MREKIKCPQCGLVQWREDACKRCRLSFAAQPSAAEPSAAQPSAAQPSAAQPQAVPAAGAPMNPYAPPAASLQPGPSGPSGPDAPYGMITEGTVQEFERGQPWMRFLAVLGYIGGALQVVIAIVLVFTVDSTDVPGGGFIALFYLAIAWVYIVFGSRLSNSAKAIANIRDGGGAEAVAEAIRHQSALWRLMGKISLAGILILVGIVVVAIFIGIVFSS